MDIIKMTNADASKVSNIYALSWKSAYKGMLPQEYLDTLSMERWTPFLTDSTYTSFILTEDERYIGTYSVAKAREEKMDGWGEIISIYLLPEYTKKGYGKLLFSHAVTYLKSQGYDRIYLWVLEQNDIARAFYEQNGFTASQDHLAANIGGKDLLEIRYVNNK